MYNGFKTHVVEDINYLMDSSVQSVTKKEGRHPKVDRDRHRESSHLPDPSDALAQTERAQTFAHQRDNIIDDPFSVCYV
jgi:hypothetical protein